MLRERGLTVAQKGIIKLSIERGQAAPKKVNFTEQLYCNFSKISQNLTRVQKNVFNYEQVIREFMRLQQLAIAAGQPVVPTPSRSMVSSYASYNRLLLRGGAPVGGQSLQNIQDFAENVAISPATLEDDPCCIECVIDSDRLEPFFAMVLTTKRLLSELDSTKPLETDETFKVIHEGYALTLIGQSDMNRVWHLR